MSKVTIPKDKNHLISFIFIALFSCVSFYTTFDGLKTYAQAKSFQEYLFLFVLVSMVQSGLVYSLIRFFKTQSWLIKSSYFSIYMFLMLISVFYSFAFYYQTLASGNYALENFKTQQTHIIQNAIQIGLAFNGVKIGAKTLADYSQKTSKKEQFISLPSSQLGSVYALSSA